jgi:hypothetical protein
MKRILDQGPSLPELIRMLERNGRVQAADDLRAGRGVVEATAYVAGGEPRYNDDEGRKLQRYIDDLHAEAEAEAEAEALVMDRHRDYEAERAERCAAIEALLPAFQGIKVPAETFSKANFERPDVDMAEALREAFVEDGAVAAMVGWDAFAAVAQRILALSPWPDDTGLQSVPAITPLVSP